MLGLLSFVLSFAIDSPHNSECLSTRLWLRRLDKDVKHPQPPLDARSVNAESNLDSGTHEHNSMEIPPAFSSLSCIPFSRQHHFLCQHRFIVTVKSFSGLGRERRGSYMNWLHYPRDLVTKAVAVAVAVFTQEAFSLFHYFIISFLLFTLSYTNQSTPYPRNQVLPPNNPDDHAATTTR
jgi:hypothetical protein